MCVGFQNAVDSFTFWVENISVYCETMTGPIIERRRTTSHLSTESQNGKLFISIVKLEDIHDSFQGLIILIPIEIRTVKRIAFSWVAITKRIVNSNSQIKLTTTKNVLQETISALKRQVLEWNLRFLREIKLGIWICLEVINRKYNIPNIFMLTVFHGYEGLDLAFFVEVFTAQIRHEQIELIKWKGIRAAPGACRLDFGLIYGSPFGVASSRHRLSDMLFIKYQK